MDKGSFIYFINLKQEKYNIHMESNYSYKQCTLCKLYDVSHKVIKISISIVSYVMSCTGKLKNEQVYNVFNN